MIDLDALEHFANESKAQGFTHCAHPDVLLALIAELRASRKVVEAARERVARHRKSKDDCDVYLRATLAELEALK